MVRFTLSRAERLTSVKAIERLFQEGQSLTRYPVRLVWMKMDRSEETDAPVQVMFSASKKKYSRAVDRNRIKRLLREAYRLYKPELYTLLPPDQTFHLAIIYTGKEIEPMENIQKKIIQALGNMIKDITPA